MNSDNNIKIVSILLPDDRLGGAESVLKKIAVYYLKRHVTVHVFFLKKSLAGAWFDLTEKYDNCILYFTNSKNERNGIFKLSKKLFRVSKKNHIDITFSSHIHLIALTSFLKKIGLYKTKYFVSRELTMIFERYTSFTLIFFKFLYYLSLKSVDLKIFQTDAMIKSFNDNLKFSKKFNSVVLHNPIDLKDLQLKSKELIPIEFGHYLVACGRLNKVKGYDLLIQAFANLNNKKFKLLILGTGPEKENLKHQIKDLGLDEQIILMGHQKNPIPFFKNAYGCILSSRIEGFPNVLLEMMSQNGRVLSTDCAGGIDKIPNLFLARKNDLHSLENSLKEMINSSEELSLENYKSFTQYLADKSIDQYMANIMTALKK